MTTDLLPNGGKVLGRHMDTLDGLRGVAIALVLLVHFVGDATPQDTLERWVTRLANYGAWGVDLFFVLSGFLITGILHDSKESPHYFRTFYVRRALRIFPLYYGILAVLFLLGPVLPIAYPEGLSESLHHQAWLWAYASNIYVSVKGTWAALPYVSHFWSLAVEEHFYLVWPVVVLAFARKTLLRICVACAVLALGLRIVLSLAGASEVLLVALTPCRLDALASGAFLAIFAREVGFDRLLQWALPSLLALAALVVLATAWNAQVGTWHEVVLSVRGTLVALTFGALLVVSVATSRASWLGRLLTSKGLRFLGKYSYGLYVFQALIASVLLDYGVELTLTRLLGSHLAAMGVQAILGIGVTLALAVLSYEFFEKPFLRLKDRLAPADDGSRARTLPRPRLA